MDIRILQLIDGAKKAEGLTVVIDVFRAFSTACYLFDRGVASIIPVGGVDEAVTLKEELFPEALLLGERNERRVDGFDFGNSPTHLLSHSLYGKQVIMTTSSGTQGLVNAQGADELITGSFVNAQAITNYIKSRNPLVVSLVCMGYECKRPTQEDTFFAELIKARLQNKRTDFESMREKLRVGDGARLLDPANHQWSPSTDFDLCLDIDRFNFVLQVTKNEKFMELRKIEMNNA